MKILFLSNTLPYDGMAGSHAIVYERIRRLAARGHDVGLACFYRQEPDEYTTDLRSFLFDLRLVSVPNKKRAAHAWLPLLSDNIKSTGSRRAITAMQREVGSMVEHDHYDVVVAEFTNMGRIFFHNRYLPATRRVISSHRSVTLLFRELSRKSWSLYSYFYAYLSRCVQRYELRLYACADYIFVLTQQEEFWIQSHIPDQRIAIVPSGADTTPVTDETEPLKREDSILFTGNYADKSNEDAVIWFLEKGWPLLRERHENLTFQIVGPNPTRSMTRLANNDPRVVITNWVSDPKEYLAKGAVFINPVRLGGGIRQKVIEAMAMKIPVVSTSLGMHGLPAMVGENCLLADTVPFMAQCVSVLLDDEQYARRVAENGYRMVAELFDWEHSIDRLEHQLFQVTQMS